MNWTATIERYLAEGRTVSGGKGDSEIQAQEAQQQGFNRQLANIFSTQFGKQSNVLNFLNQKLTNQVENPTGFSAPQMAALNTANTEGAAKAFANAQQAVNAGEAARGGSTLPSGVDAQLRAQNATGAAAQVAQGQNQIQLANAAQQQNNYWNAVNGLNGVAATENPLGYGGEYNSGSGNVAGLGQAYFGTQQDPALGLLGGVVGGAVTGGLNKLYGSKG